MFSVSLRLGLSAPVTNLPREPNVLDTHRIEGEFASQFGAEDRNAFRGTEINLGSESPDYHSYMFDLNGTRYIVKRPCHQSPNGAKFSGYTQD